MPKINIDDLVEPIEVTVSGKTYTVNDIPPELATRMAKISTDAEKAEKAAKKAEEAGEEPIPVDQADTEAMMIVMAEMLGAPKAEMAKLGMRKRLMLIKSVMETITGEFEAKNVPKAVAAKLLP